MVPEQGDEAGELRLPADAIVRAREPFAAGGRFNHEPKVRADLLDRRDPDRHLFDSSTISRPQRRLTDSGDRTRRLHRVAFWRGAAKAPVAARSMSSVASVAPSSSTRPSPTTEAATRRRWARSTPRSLYNSSFIGNTATGHGANSDDASRCSVMNNGQHEVGSGGNGGALHSDGQGADVLLCGVTILDNKDGSGAFGGGLFFTSNT